MTAAGDAPKVERRLERRRGLRHRQAKRAQAAGLTFQQIHTPEPRANGSPASRQTEIAAFLNADPSDVLEGSSGREASLRSQRSATIRQTTQTWRLTPPLRLRDQNSASVLIQQSAAVSVQAEADADL